MSNKTLTPKQQRFVSEYLIDGNGKQAAIRSGYSEKTAAAQASRLLTNVNVVAAIKAGQNNTAERNKLTSDDIIAELEEARKLAKDEGAASAMVAASMGKAKILGFLIDKSEVQTEGNVNINIKFK